MSKVVINETPADIATAKAKETFDCTDSLGRKYVLKRPGVLMQFRAVEMLGETARNAVYMGMALPLFWIVSIDGQDEATISSKRMLEALIQRLGDDGIAAVLAAVNESVGPLDPDADKEKLKN